MSDRRWGLLWVAAGASLWGTDTLLRRPLTRTLGSAQIVWLEHLILTLVLLPLVWRSRREWKELGAREWAAVLAIAWGGSALGTVLFTEAIRVGNPTTAVLLQKTQPLFTALLAWVMLGEKLEKRYWACLGVALAAGYLVSFGWARARPQGLLAAGLAIGAAALWGSCTVLGRFALRSVSFPVLTVLRIVAALPVLTVLGGGRVEAGWREAGLLTAMALVPGLAALLLYYYGLRHTRASLAALGELSFPATAALLNWTFLGARISAGQAAGFAMLWGVILYLERRGR